MKQLLTITTTLITFFLFSFQNIYSQNNSWQQVSDFGGIPRLHAVAFTIGNYSYVGLGNDGSSFLQDFWKYDPQTNLWTPVANFIGTARDRAVAFSLNGKGYVGLGLDGSGYKNDFYEYNPATNSWSQIANFPGTPRLGSVAFSCGTKGFVGTGNDGTDRSDFYSYNPINNSWTAIANFGGGNRRFGVSFSINNYGYVGTGLNGTIDYSDFWKYDTLTNVWTSISTLPGLSRAGASSFSIGNFGFIGTGSSPSYLSDFWEYNSITNIWTQRPNFMGSSRELGVGFSINGIGFLGTGYSTVNTKDMFKYIPICSDFDTTISVQVCGSYLFDGQVLTSSGQYSTNYTSINGCDSIITINLTITQPTSSSIAPNICSNSYTAPDGQVYSQSGTYTAIIPNAAGCDSTITINLTLTPAPIVNAGADQAICEGTTVTLSGTGATVYNWSDGIINAVAFQPPAGTINYIVTGTSANGCTDTDTVTVVVNPLPIVSFTGDNTTGCSPLSVALMSDFQYAYCNWIIDGMSYSDSACDMLFLNFNSGCHDVTLQQTTAEGCMNQLSMLDFICVQSTPTSGFIASPLVITDLNTPVTFTNTTVPTVLSAWDFDDGTGTYETNPVHYFQTNQEADTFHVILYSQMDFPDGCISSSSLYIYYIPSDVVPSDVSIPTGFSPNNDGANDTWTISGLENYPDATINVFNRWGQLLFKGGPSNPTWNGLYLGELLPTADYYYIIDLGEGSKYNGVVTLKQ